MCEGNSLPSKVCQVCPLFSCLRPYLKRSILCIRPMSLFYTALFFWWSKNPKGKTQVSLIVAIPQSWTSHGISRKPCSKSEGWTALSCPNQRRKREGIESRRRPKDGTSWGEGSPVSSSLVLCWFKWWSYMVLWLSGAFVNGFACTKKMMAVLLKLKPPFQAAKQHVVEVWDRELMVARQVSSGPFAHQPRIAHQLQAPGCAALGLEPEP